MALSPEEDEVPESSSYARDEAGSAITPQGARSGLSLGGTRPLPKTPTARPLQQSQRTPTERLDEGIKRAKNIGEALGMIVVLLLQVLFQRILWGRAKHTWGSLKLRVMRLYHAFGILLKPHVTRMRDTARQTKNQAVRAILLALLKIVTPVERSALQAAQTAKQEGQKLAESGAKVTLKVLVPFFTACGQLLKTGFNQAAVQRVVARLIQLTEESP